MADFQSLLSTQIYKEFSTLLKMLISIPSSLKLLKNIEGVRRKISVRELLAYQIGWGKSVIRWYESGVLGKIPQMPGDGFTQWKYQEIAEYFYKTYLGDSEEHQLLLFKEIVLQILQIVEQEHQNGNLERLGVWSWCTLPSGKKWPLSKWIKVNTVAPYRRAIQLIKKANY